MVGLVGEFPVSLFKTGSLASIDPGVALSSSEDPDAVIYAR